MSGNEIHNDIDTESKDESMNTSFKEKIVYQLDCSFCWTSVCSRGMKAILLSDTTVEMFSTDYPFPASVDTVGRCYSTSKCRCKIKDAACTQCGNVIGYHVCYPCRSCLLSSNNGHFWMFYNEGIEAFERLKPTGKELKRWGSLAGVGDENCVNDFQWMTEECIR